MDFFAAQDLARRKTKWLIFYYILSLLCMVIGIYVVVILVFNVGTNLPAEAGGDPADGGFSSPRISLWHPGVFLIVALANSTIVGLGSLSKVVELRGGGGQHVASLMGGRHVPTTTTDPGERRLLNVVEEMALASGVSVPPVYVMDNEPGINAFAAGYTPADAVVGVNRGTIDQLNRDELQGVIAHEFSHILNGDMRMNIRLIGILYGIQLLATIGYFILRMSGGRGRSSDDNKGAGAILAVGLAVLVFGSIGQFFARLIKASISRQREFLADASAVQFTRYPDGIGGALKMIAASSSGSAIKSSEAESLSHMFFASCFTSRFSEMFATHPPLMKRITKLDNSFDGNFREYVETRQRMAAARERIRSGKSGDTKDDKKSAKLPMPMGGEFFPMEIADRFSIHPAFLLAAIGAPTQEDVDYSKTLIAQIPKPLFSAAHQVFTARCVAFATLLDEDESMRSQQLDTIATDEGASSAEFTMKLWPLVNRLDLALRLPVMEILQGSLCDLSAKQYLHFRKTVQKLVKMDGQISLFEFVVRHHLLMHLDRRFSLKRPPVIRYNQTARLRDEIELMLSAFAVVGEADELTTRKGYVLAMQTAGLAIDDEDSAELKTWEVVQLEKCMQKLAAAAPQVKKAFLKAAAVLITYDHEITVAEAELFRAVAESLDCPVPAFVAGKTINEGTTTDGS